MDPKKRKKLEGKGWTVGSAQDLLGLSDEEMQIVEMKAALIAAVRTCRERKGITQTDLAKKIGSSVARISKLENGSPDISFELVLRALIALGVSKKKIGETILRAA